MGHYFFFFLIQSFDVWATIVLGTGERLNLVFLK